MTPAQLETIRLLRLENYSYQFIGDELGLSINTVKSVCRRHGFTTSGNRKTKKEKQNAKLCEWCHRPLKKDKVKKRFCSEDCRQKWWQDKRRVEIIDKKTY